MRKLELLPTRDCVATALIFGWEIGFYTEQQTNKQRNKQAKTKPFLYLFRKTYTHAIIPFTPHTNISIFFRQSFFFFFFLNQNMGSLGDKYIIFDQTLKNKQPNKQTNKTKQNMCQGKKIARVLPLSSALEFMVSASLSERYRMNPRFEAELLGLGPFSRPLGYCTSYPKSSKTNIFCALSQNYQHLCEK